MRDVSAAINQVDTGKAIDKAICGTGTGNWAHPSTGGDSDTSVANGTKCPSTSGVTTTLGFEKLVSTANDTASTSLFADDKKMEVLPNTSKNISKDISKLNRDQHGVVSSAFAKAHEGAEIVEIRSISTTSVMVNACYDVLAEGLPVSPYGCAVHT